jgi:hypothetical protein
MWRWQPGNTANPRANYGNSHPLDIRSVIKPASIPQPPATYFMIVCGSLFYSLFGGLNCATIGFCLTSRPCLADVPLESKQYVCRRNLAQNGRARVSSGGNAAARGGCTEVCTPNVSGSAPAPVLADGEADQGMSSGFMFRILRIRQVSAASENSHYQTYLLDVACAAMMEEEKSAPLHLLSTRCGRCTLFEDAVVY